MAKIHSTDWRIVIDELNGSKIDPYITTMQGLLSYEEHSKWLNRTAYYMGMADYVSKQSYCNNAKVGAVISKNGSIIAEGYNGTITGFPNVCEVDGVTTDFVLHAESNAIMKVAKSNNSTEGASMYCTLSPCKDCFKLILQSGIKELYFCKYYRNVDFLKFFSENSIYVCFFDFELYNEIKK